MSNKVFSFSTKNGSDTEYIEELKKRAAAKGISFSWLVVTAVKNYVEQLNELDRP